MVIPYNVFRVLLPCLFLLATHKPCGPRAIGQTFTLASKVLGETRRISVYLLPGYADSAALYLPVLYMPDGGLRKNSLRVVSLVQVSVGNGTRKPFILVDVENTARRHDLTGPTTNPENKRLPRPWVARPRSGSSSAPS